MARRLNGKHYPSLKACDRAHGCISGQVTRWLQPYK
jgi:hypothetical protein